MFHHTYLRKINNMKKKLYHYYPDNKPNTDTTTGCGREGREVGGLIAPFFRGLKIKDRCKICHKRYEKDQKKNKKKA